MALSIVQHVSGHGTLNTNPPQSLTLGAGPVQGNLLIAFVQYNVATAITWNTASWTVINATQAVLGNALLFCTALFRYVQHGDTAALPNFGSSGNTYWAAEVYEVSGISGVWSADFLATIQNQFNDTGHNLATQPMYVPAGTLLLSGYGKYNSSNSPTVTGSGWTQDEVGNNFANFGGWGSSSNLTGSPGFTTSLAVDVVYTGGQPYGYVQVALIPAGATILWPIIRQSTYYASFSSTPAAVTLVCPPVTGNLLIADIAGGPAAAGSGWTQLATVGSTTATMTRHYRYVQAGDATALPAVTAASGNFAINITEISYIASTIGNAAFSTKTGTQASGATMTTTSDTTPFDNDIVLTTWMNLSGTGLITSATSGYYWIIEQNDIAVAQTWGSQSNVYPSPNSTVQSTATVPNSGVSTTYIQTIFSLEFGSVGAIGLDIAVGAHGTALKAVSGTADVDIVVAGVGVNIQTGVGAIGINIAVAGTATGLKPSAGSIGMNIDVASASKYTFPAAGAIGLNIAVAGALVNANPAFNPGGGDVKDWKRRYGRWKEIEEELIAAEEARRGKIRAGVVDAYERSVEGKTDPEPETEPEPFKLPAITRQYSAQELGPLLKYGSIRKHSPSNHDEQDDEEAILHL